MLESSDAAGWAVGLDPATNTSDLGDAPQMRAIYGGLFATTGTGGVSPDLATGYSFSDGAKTLTITLRHGVTFQDGTPFNAQAVAFNIRRDLDPKNACICDAFFPVSSVTTTGNYTVVLHLSKPFSPIIDAFPGFAPNWIASPTAIKKEGETKFAQYPVGAGPFEVVSDVYSSQLVLKRFPNYWQKGHPYLNSLVFKSATDNSSSYDAVLAGNAQLTENIATPTIVVGAKKQSNLDVQIVSGRNAVSGVELNTKEAPFNNIVAREALYYATDPGPINKALNYGLGTVIESPSLPNTPFYEQDVPGYRTYNLSKAQALVKQLGGLKFDLAYTGPASKEEAVALSTQWDKAGMDVTLVEFPTLVQNLQSFKTGNWQAQLQGAGGLNPAIGTGSGYWRYYSTGPFSGTHDPGLDQLINEAAATTNTGRQVSIYKQVYSYLSNKAYLVFVYLTDLYNVSSNKVVGPGVSTPLEFPIWADVWLKA